MPNLPRWIIDVSDPSKSGLFLSQNGTLIPASTTFVRREVLALEVQLLVNTPTQVQQPLDITGGTLAVTIGDIVAESTAGIFALSYGADTTGLTALSYSTTAAQLETALNANPTLNSGSVSVTVHKAGNTFVICWNQVGARTLLTCNATGLSPLVTPVIYRGSTGAAAVREIQVIALERTSYASFGGWTIGTAVAGSIASVVTGTATAAAVFDLTLSPTAIGGSFSLTYGRSQVFNLTVPGNTAVKASGIITCFTGVTANAYFDLPGATQLVRFWYNLGGGTAPSAPVGGSLQVITTVASLDSSEVTAEKTTVVIEAHADFTALVVNSNITWTAAAYGAKTNSAYAGTSGFSFGSAIAGNSGILSQGWIIIYDEVGSVGIWFDATSTGATGYPPEAAVAARQLRIVIAPGDSSTTVAAALQTAVDGDAKFTSTNTGNSVKASVDALGALSNGTYANVSGLSAITTQTGFVGIAQLGYAAMLSDFSTKTGGRLNAAYSGPGKWRLNATTAGVFATPTLNEGALIKPTFFTGSIPLNTASLLLASDDLGTNELAATLQVRYTDAATSGTITCLNMPVKIIQEIPV